MMTISLPDKKSNFLYGLFFIRSFLNRVGVYFGMSRNKIKPLDILLVFILLLGIFARVWEIRTLPPGLHQDEASTGLEAYYLYHYGVDRNGFSFPLQFVSWGSGMNALVYAYLLIPFVAIGGLTPMTIRLPMLISGILFLPLAYYVARQTIGKKQALLALFFLAISPWHILQSRWAHDANLLPFTFLVAYACLLKSKTDNKWFLIACIFFALCIYVYGPAYALIPIFLTYSIPFLYRSGRVSRNDVLLGVLVFAILCVPFGILLVFNAAHLDTMRIGIFTIPHLPSQPRYESMLVFFNTGFISRLFQNLMILFLRLSIQVDGLWNTVIPYGYFYTFTFPFAVFGFVNLLRKPHKTMEHFLLLGWCISPLLIGVMVTANFNHINVIFTPLIFCVTLAVDWIGKRFKYFKLFIIYGLFVAFVVFTVDYHYGRYREQAGKNFFASGLLQAIDFASQSKGNLICITDSVQKPYIYVLFAEKIPPMDYLKDIEYVDQSAPFRDVRSLGRYSFGIQNCPNASETIYILTNEKPPNDSLDYQVKTFDGFSVYMP